MRRPLSVLGVMLSLAMLITAVPLANALTITQLSNQNVKDGFPITACADVGGAATANRTPVGPFPCNNQLNEEWVFANGQFLGIGTANGISKCLSVHGNSTKPGAHVELDTCASSNTGQLWSVEVNGLKKGEVLGSSGLCLDSQGQIGGGLQLVINNCNGSAGQTWDLNGITITQLSNQNVKDGFPITACADVGGAATANRTPVGPFPCNNQLNERWIYSNGQFIGIGTANGVSKCLSVHGNSTAPGTPVELDTCKSGNDSQLWFATGGPTVSEIIGVLSGLCLDSQGQIGGGLQLVINTCNKSAGQQWDLK